MDKRWEKMLKTFMFCQLPCVTNVIKKSLYHNVIKESNLVGPRETTTYADICDVTKSGRRSQKK